MTASKVYAVVALAAYGVLAALAVAVMVAR